MIDEIRTLVKNTAIQKKQWVICRYDTHTEQPRKADAVPDSGTPQCTTHTSSQSFHAQDTKRRKEWKEGGRCSGPSSQMNPQKECGTHRTELKGGSGRRR